MLTDSFTNHIMSDWRYHLGKKLLVMSSNVEVCTQNDCKGLTSVLDMDSGISSMRRWLSILIRDA